MVRKLIKLASITNISKRGVDLKLLQKTDFKFTTFEF